MPFNMYDQISSLNDSTEEWKIRARAASIWKGTNRKTGEFKGLNVVFFDDSSERIHAFISSQIFAEMEEELKEGQIYVVQNFKVKTYNGDETSRATRNDRHIYFSTQTKIEKHSGPGLKIPDHSFDLFPLYSMIGMASDNRFLTDVIGVIVDVQPKAVYTKDGIERSHVQLTITDGKTEMNVTFFNEFGDSFIYERAKHLQDPEIIVITFANVSEWKDKLYLTNFPATRVYFKPNHPSVDNLKLRHAKPDFYALAKDDEKEETLPTVTISELKKLSEAHIEKKVICKLVVKKVDEKMSWYICFCTQCDIQVLLVDGMYKCNSCGRIIPYPDKRFQLYTLCSDETGIIPVVWPNEEIVRFTGKEFYEVDVEMNEDGDVEKFPPMLKFALKKIFNFTILLTKENVKEGSNVYKAVQISEVMDITGNHSPVQNITADEPQTEINAHTQPLQTKSDVNTPPTVHSTNKTRPRITTDNDKQKQPVVKQPRFLEIKKEKV